MKVIIAGSRYTKDALNLVGKAIRESGFRVTEVVSGCVGNVDHAGLAWAGFARNLFGLDVGIKKFPYPSDADLIARGLKPNIPRAARGQIRNGWMANYAAPDGGLILIWDGESTGSAGMLKQAKAKGLRIHELRVSR